MGPPTTVNWEPTVSCAAEELLGRWWVCDPWCLLEPGCSVLAVGGGRRAFEAEVVQRLHCSLTVMPASPRPGAIAAPTLALPDGARVLPAVNAATPGAIADALAAMPAERVDVLKLDLDGGELAALEDDGLLRALQSRVVQLLVEFSHSAADGVPATEALMANTYRSIALKLTAAGFYATHKSSSTQTGKGDTEGAAHLAGTKYIKYSFLNVNLLPVGCAKEDASCPRAVSGKPDDRGVGHAVDLDVDSILYDTRAEQHAADAAVVHWIGMAHGVVR